MSSGPTPFLPYGRQSIDAADIDAVVEVLKGDYLTKGPAVDAFEADFAKVVGARFSVACASGTAALHLSALALGLGPGDVVIVPSMTFLASATAMRLAGAEVVFSDVDPHTGLMTLETCVAALARAHDVGVPKAVIPVHMCGRPVADMHGLRALANKEGLAVIEDACHALGSTYDNSGEMVPVGSCADSDLVCFSAHPVKTIVMGEGGIVTTNDASLYARLTRYRSHGMTRDENAFVHRDEAFTADGVPHAWYYEMQELGLNYRASDIHCALGRSQLSKLDQFIAHRRALVDFYNVALAGVSPHLKPPVPALNCNPGWHLYAVQIDFDALGKSRDDVMLELKERGIGTQVHYHPVHRQPYYRDRYGLADLPGADLYAAKTLSIPLYPALTDVDAARVVTALREVVSYT